VKYKDTMQLYLIKWAKTWGKNISAALDLIVVSYKDTHLKENFEVCKDVRAVGSGKFKGGNLTTCWARGESLDLILSPSKGILEFPSQ